MRTKLTILAASWAAGSLMAPMALAQPQPPQPPQPQARRASRAAVIRPGGGSFLGIGVAEVDSERARTLNLKEERGVEVKSVEPDSAASKAGFKEGDVVLEYNGQRVEGSEQFIRLVHETPVGRPVKLLIWRSGQTQTIAVTMGKREGPRFIEFGPEQFEMPIPRIPEIRIPDTPRMFTSWRSTTLGIESESLGSQLAEYFGVKDGVLVRAVVKGSAAEKAGLKAGDVIVKVDDRKVAGPREIADALRSLRAKKTFPVTVVRDRKEMKLSVILDDDASIREPRRAVMRMEGYEL
jgi:serine protease Do